MARQSLLTADQWAAARRRWEGAGQEGFAWLAREIQAAWGIPVHRKSLEQAARVKGWSIADKEPSEPLSTAGASEPAVADMERNIPVAASKGILPSVGNIPAAATLRPRSAQVADELVDSPAAVGWRPGRPTKFRPEFAQQIVAYFDVSPEEEVKVEQPNGTVRLQRMARVPPMLVGFAHSIGVDLTTLNRWATDIDIGSGKPRFPDFADAYAHARELHEGLIAKGAMLGLYDSKAAALLLKNLHGWQDQPARKVAVAPVSKDELEARFGARMAAARERMLTVLAERRDLLVNDPGDDD